MSSRSHYRLGPSCGSAGICGFRGALHSLRHTLLAAQRKCLGLRPYAKIVSELISCWEHAEPPMKAIVTTPG